MQRCNNTSLVQDRISVSAFHRKHTSPTALLHPLQRTYIPSPCHQGGLKVHQRDLLLQHLLGKGSREGHRWVDDGGRWWHSPQTAQGFSVALQSPLNIWWGAQGERRRAKSHCVYGWGVGVGVASDPEVAG